MELHEKVDLTTHSRRSKVQWSRHHIQLIIYIANPAIVYIHTNTTIQTLIGEHTHTHTQNNLL